jgi:hypothetical protein
LLSPTWSPPEIKPVINWPAYGLKEKFPSDGIRISENTFRPFYSVEDEENRALVPWHTNAKRIYGSGNKLISCYNLFIKYFLKYNKFPNRDAYLIFCYQSLCANKRGMTLPYLIDTWYAEVLADYQPILQLIKDTQMSVAEIRSTLLRSYHYEKRKSIE